MTDHLDVEIRFEADPERRGPGRLRGVLLRYGEMFDAKTREAAGAGAHIMVRDTTCRLFGYQGLLNGHGAFSFDHMFGF